MKALYISYDGMCDALGRSQVIPYLQGLAGYGHNLHVLSFEKANLPDAETEEVGRIFHNAGIVWHRLRFRSTPPLISKLIDLIKLHWKARKLQLSHKFDIIHCRSYIAAFAGIALKRHYGPFFIFDIRGFWIDERIEGNIWRLTNPVIRWLYKYMRKKEVQFFKSADAVVSLTYMGKSIIRDKFGDLVAQKTVVIPCCVDLALFSRANIDQKELLSLRKKLGISENTFVLSYLGSTGTWYMTDEMLNFFKKVIATYSDSVFLFITSDEPAAIKQKALRIGLPHNRVLVVKAKRTEVPLHIMLSNLSIYFIKPVFSKKASCPTKQAEILSMGVPVVCNSGIGDIDWLFENDNFGILVKSFTDYELNKAVEMIDEALKLEPVKLRANAAKYYNLADGVEKYNNIYTKLTLS